MNMGLGEEADAGLGELRIARISLPLLKENEDTRKTNSGRTKGRKLSLNPDPAIGCNI